MSDFESFCSRMWLDNEDENLSPHAAGNRLTRDEYVERWYDWLLDKYQNRDLKEDSCGGIPEGWIAEKNFKRDVEEPLTIQEEIDLFRTDPEC